MIPEFSTDIIGIPTHDGYGYTKRASFSSLRYTKGRSTFRLTDSHAFYQVSITLVMTHEQFVAWQDFWTNQLDNGVKWFRMPLMLDDPALFNSGIEVYTVHALGPWSATGGHNRRWQVSLTLEVPSGVIFPTDLCPVIYGGPTDNLAPDDIWPGDDLTNLPADIIAPCPGV